MILFIFWFFNCNFFYFILFILYFDYLLNFLHFYIFESILTIISQLLITLSLNLNFIFILFLFYINYYINTFNIVTFFIIYFELNNNLNFINIESCVKILAPLYNGYMIIHPILLYLAIILFLFIFKFSLYSILFKIQLRIIYKQFIINFIFIITAIFLGCAWANQELNWGGWWSWDIIELGSIIILLFLIKALHITHINTIFFYNNSITYFLYFLFFWFGARFSFFNSVHSFIDQQNTIILTKKLYFMYLIVLFYYSTYSIKLVIFNKFIKIIDIFMQLIFFSILTDSFINILSNFIFFINILLKLLVIVFFKIKFIPINITTLDLFILLFYLNKNSFKTFYFLHIFLYLLIFSFIFTNFYFNIFNTFEIVFANYYFSTSIQYFVKNIINFNLLLNNTSVMHLNNSLHFFIITNCSQSIFNKLITQIFELEIFCCFFIIITNLYFIIKINFDFIIIMWSFIFIFLKLIKLVKLAF